MNMKHSKPPLDDKRDKFNHADIFSDKNMPAVTRLNVDADVLMPALP